MNSTENQTENTAKKTGAVAGFLGRLFKKNNDDIKDAAENAAPAEPDGAADTAAAVEADATEEQPETAATADEAVVTDAPAFDEGIAPNVDGEKDADEPEADADADEPELPELPELMPENKSVGSADSEGEKSDDATDGGDKANNDSIQKPEVAAQPTPQKNDYTDSVRAVRRDRVIDSIICAAALAIVIALGVWAAFGEFKIMGILAAAALAIPLVGLLVKNLCDAGSVADIAYRGVYAARLTCEQQSTIRRNLLRQGQRFYLICFLAVVVPESAVLVICSRYFNSSVFLIIMAVFALAALGCVLIASLCLAARLNVRDAFCTVSTRGIITSHEVIPFSSKAGDVDVLVKFDDYYLIRYKRAEIFGLRHNAVLLFPADGVLKTGLGAGDDVAAVLAGALGLGSYKVKAAPFAESPDYYNGTEIRSSATV